jgi:multidrug resistance protein, MATE family
MNTAHVQLEAKVDRAGTLRELLAVALPLIISYGSTAMMYVFDRAFLSWDSVESMAAALPAGVLHYNLAILAMGTVAYSTAFIGQYEGAGQHHRVGPVVWQGVYISIAAALAMLCLLPFAPMIFQWFGHDPEVQGLELRFFRVICLGTLPLLLDTALSCFFSGRGQTVVVMIVNTIGMLINIALDYTLIFGKFGFPRMGIEGAALATVCAFSSISLMYIGVMALQYGDGRYCLWSGGRFDRELFGRLLRFGLPSGMQQFLDMACWSMFIQLIGRLGTEQLSATGLVFNLNGAVFIPLLGIGTAVTALVGHRIGEGRPQLAVRTTWLAFGLATAYTLASCFVYLLLPDLILKPYGLTDHDSLRETVVVLLRFVAVYSFFDTMFVVFNAAIRGAGDTRFALGFSFTCGVVFLVAPTYIVSIWLGSEGFWLVWYFVTTLIVVLGLGFLARFQQGRWKSMRVIEHTAPELAREAEEAPEQGLPVAAAR